MRKIQKIFSLEPMTSRMPSVLPAYKDNELYYFDDKHLKAREYEYPSNYGMIPLRISYSSMSAATGVTYDFDCSSGATTMSFERLSKWYYFFKEYYHLLNDYGHCHRTYGSAMEYYYYESGERYADQMIYGTEEQTYRDLDAEFKSKGGIVKVTENGAIDIGFYKWICDSIIPSYHISDEYMEYWKRKKLFYPDVIKWIAWFTERLMYEPDDGSLEIYTATTYDKDGAVKEKEHWDCKQEDIDCCDCNEYFNRGGRREYERMKEWYDSLQNNIELMNSAITENLDCFISTMDDKIQLHNSLDDLGQYSIFSTVYDVNTDYRTASYGDTRNTHGGTVVEVNRNTMILRDGHTGYDFSPYHMEKIYDENAWEDYTERYIHDSLCPQCGYYGEITDVCPRCGYNGHDERYGAISEVYGDNFLRNEREVIADGYRYYAFDKDNVMYVGNTEDEVREKMQNAYEYEIIPVNAILIDGVLYDIQRSEYGIYDPSNKYIGGKKFFVYRENDTSTPFTLINGKKIYAEWYANPNPNFDNKPCYFFTFFKVDQKTKGIHCNTVEKAFNIINYKPFGREASVSEDAETSSGDVINYITYYGQIFEVEYGAVSLTIDDFEYKRIFGYAYDKDGQLMYLTVSDDGDGYTPIMVDEDILEEIPNSKVICDTGETGFCDKVIIGLDYEPVIYNARELSNITVSKLTDLESTDVLVDDIGNKIDGRYNPNKSNIYNHQPPEGTELDLLYEVGNTSNIRRFRLTVEDIDDFEDYDSATTTNYFVGNIITNMVFYYKDVDGNVVTETEVEWSGSSLESIHKAQSLREDVELSGDSSGNTVMFDGDDIYCDVTYYIGATLSRKEGEPFMLAYEENGTGDTNYNYGVQYNETVKFVKENREYYLKKMVGKQIPTTFNSPSAHSISYPIYVYKLVQNMEEIEGYEYGTYFQSPLANFKTEINLINDDLTTNYNEYADMDTYNNIHVSPTFKQEYMLGISSLENINSDIYIERGINAAFERHLKLGEITSMEALEQFGLNFFKIIDS